MKAPVDVFQKTVQYFPTVSINILIQNKNGEFLFVKRKNNPSKGLYWVPGGRIFAGETLEVATKRILLGEVGIDAPVDYISDVFNEEIFSTDDFDEEDAKRYSSETHHVHYLTTIAYVYLEEPQNIKLDAQSSDFIWSKTRTHNHPYHEWYFELLNKTYKKNNI